MPLNASEGAIEAELKTKGLNAPRVTPAQIDATIHTEYFYVVPGTTLTMAVLTLRNGFLVTGESAAASPENFDAAIGRRIARENARNKIWELEGYLLREKLFEGDFIDRALNKLTALEDYGVDNWEGYGDAMASLRSDEDED